LAVCAKFVEESLAANIPTSSLQRLCV